MRIPVPRWLCQAVFDGLCAVTGPGPQPWRKRAAHLALTKVRRQLITLSADAPIESRLRDTRIAFPLSHNLLLYQRERKEYSANLTRVSTAVLSKYPHLRAVDVGGNIGDSVLLMRVAGVFPILTIEGDERFHRYLVENTADQPHISIERSFVCPDGCAPLVAIQDGGTTRLMEQTGRGTTAARQRSLQAILRDHPEFSSAKLMKIDADGMDFTILHSALEWASAARPVLFFEYDPTLSRGRSPNGVETVRSLAERGYEYALAWDNHGKFLLGAALNQWELFADLDAYVRDPGAVLYWDLCCFHREDSDIFDTLHSSERARGMVS
jgi:FkbM family methyltransferase